MVVTIILYSWDCLFRLYFPNDAEGLLSGYYRSPHSFRSGRIQNLIVKSRNPIDEEEETRRFMENAFHDGSLKTTGTAIDKIMPLVSRFANGNRQRKKLSIIEKLMKFFEKYIGLVW